MNELTHMINLNHPWYGVDVQKATPEEEEGFRDRGYVPLDELRQMEARIAELENEGASMNETLQRIYSAVIAEPTWHESNSLLAQRDMRKRCAEKAAEVASEEIAKRDARIADLERQLAAAIRPARVQYESRDIL